MCLESVVGLDAENLRLLSQSVCLFLWPRPVFLLLCFLLLSTTRSWCHDVLSKYIELSNLGMTSLKPVAQINLSFVTLSVAPVMIKIFLGRREWRPEKKQRFIEDR